MASPRFGLLLPEPLCGVRLEGGVEGGGEVGGGGRKVRMRVFVYSCSKTVLHAERFSHFEFERDYSETTTTTTPHESCL